uniref:HU family DNA-binding protein n=1 Tax=Congzhengia minquanensis TaxID=2763657 RepID=A0A926HY83_9FIRM|nr:HU family DNA-binding protein [Congzhengia minquanensis]
MKNKVQYTQKDIVNELCKETGYSKYEIERVLEALEFIVQDKLGDKDNIVEIKPFSGLRLCSDVISSKDYHSNLRSSGYIDPEYIIQLSAGFTEHFKRKLRKLHKMV